eukprot:CAMPEP_0197828832 /NCGR_PEP_ID=MMETSP1437-20131217/5354_1 /TAXON_ID=49252 ORGANISM="Eucampia antarctica, Strain CCMP1452" /NCGR_SAMPLE_ID=MMETSP1437 /ASSEMBLY_ACC=CAM_ASM_001096 /LENGTH=183 /DNA_ID=CAMNT_0043430231 /DNA_START=355 /DNA_END=906 /DNA_ORIENTATION=+
MTESTTWQVRAQFKKIVTTKGKIVSPTFLFEWKFMEDENFEPPQGTLQVLTKDDDKDNNNVFSLQKGRWTLSEDPNDRKDSLWIWGLFKEPLYPFLLLTMETPTIPCGGDDDDDDSIPPLEIYSQITHRRDNTRGAILSSSPTIMTARVRETVNADLIGAAQVEIYEEKSIGQITIQPKRNTN